MKYFKANKEIRAIDESQEFLINDEWLEISHNEMIEILNPPKTETEILNKKINEAKLYLSETSWIWEKYNRNVTVLGNLTNDEFKLKYADIITKQEEARVLINTLELELQGL